MWRRFRLADYVAAIRGDTLNNRRCARLCRLRFLMQQVGAWHMLQQAPGHTGMHERLSWQCPSSARSPARARIYATAQALQVSSFIGSGCCRRWRTLLARMKLLHSRAQAPHTFRSSRTFSHSQFTSVLGAARLAYFGMNLNRIRAFIGCGVQ